MQYAASMHEEKPATQNGSLNMTPHEAFLHGTLESSCMDGAREEECDHESNLAPISSQAASGNRQSARAHGLEAESTGLESARMRTLLHQP